MRSIWAVAVNTVKQALRMKIAVIFILLLAVLLPIMAMTSTGDNTLKGKLQTFVSYGLSLTSLLLCLLTLIVSVFTLASDIEHRQIYTVITKPIRRFQFIFGKLLGVLMLSGVLLVLFSGLIYGIVVYAPNYLHPSQSELEQANNEFYTARKALSPPEPDVSKEVVRALGRLIAGRDIEQMYKGMSETKINALKELIDTGDIGRIYKTIENTEVGRELTNVAKVSKRTADVAGELIWEFENVRPSDPNGSVFIRFKVQVAVTPPDSQIYSQWAVGDYRRYIAGTAPMYPFPPEGTPRKDPVKTFREIEIPAAIVADDGYLAVVFINHPWNNTPVTFPLEDGIKLLYKADTFRANFIRAVLIIACRQVFLACLGVFGATFLSLPVALLLCIAVFFTANVSAFVIESFDYLDSDSVFFVYLYTVKLFVSLMPQFDKYSPSQYLVPAELLSWSTLGWVVFYLVCIKSMLLLIFGLAIFRFRELARIII